MILVDSSVWISYFSRTPSRTQAALDALLDEPLQLATTGLILCEVLQGTRNNRERLLIQSTLLDLDRLPEPGIGIYLAANEIYRSARARGFTVRSTIDCILAAQCIDAGVAIFHRDRDFDRIARVSRLEIYRG